MRQATKFNGTVYHWQNMGQFAKLIGDARRLWNQRAREYFEAHGDRGTCVMGAGIAVYQIPPRCKKHRSVIIIDSPLYQGCLTWEASVNEVLDFLRNGGLDCFYAAGMMD